ncbi:MAG: nuclear transport factor 2 family protein [Anaerolineae bacterium]|nr:nuclear transport factor 2 family protein [Anaerolineae bacterium]MCO5193644.1 nuclear transport factor 2 family protein [Anaerolineae bacterium]MCO5200067.1 nuclear transport factor 2 family protein [Anaerolineae bacterium]MCO5206516.1 nuclear transport factor 2 family protein [Anaerolineae bacterium]
MSSQDLIERFYQAFQNRDHAGMLACYHPDITFHDPVFGELNGKRAGAMWHMLCERGDDLVITYRDIVANETSGSAHWEATYTFSTGRKVHNIIDAQFRFADELIIEHNDTFDLYRWARMALGPVGTLVGWTSRMQGKIGDSAEKSLERFIRKHPEYSDDNSPGATT